MRITNDEWCRGTDLMDFLKFLSRTRRTLPNTKDARNEAIYAWLQNRRRKLRKALINGLKA